MRVEGEWEDRHTTPVEAWLSLEKAKDALRKYQIEPNALSEEEWDLLCPEVDNYEEKLDKVIFEDYIEGILFLHKDWDTPEFREKLEASEKLYSYWRIASYYLEITNLNE